MGLIISNYDKEKNIDKCFYDSSNIYASICYDKPNDLKDLTVIFKGGRAYTYKDIIVQHILFFKNGFVGDGGDSQGKSFNKYIKNYKFEKNDNFDMSKLEEEKKILLEGTTKKETDVNKGELPPPKGRGLLARFANKELIQ